MEFMRIACDISRDQKSRVRSFAGMAKRQQKQGLLDNFLTVGAKKSKGKLSLVTVQLFNNIYLP